MCALEREQRVTQLQLHRGQADRWHVSHGVQNVLFPENPPLCSGFCGCFFFFPSLKCDMARVKAKHLRRFCISNVGV